MAFCAIIIVSLVLSQGEIDKSEVTLGGIHMLILTVSGDLGERSNHIQFEDKSFTVKNQDIQTTFSAETPMIDTLRSLVVGTGSAIAVFTKWQVLPEGDTKYRIVTNTTDNYNVILRRTSRSVRFEAYDTNVSLTQCHNLASDKCKIKITFDKGEVRVDVEDMLKGTMPHWYTDKDNYGFEVQYEGIDYEHWLYATIEPPYTVTL